MCVNGHDGGPAGNVGPDLTLALNQLEDEIWITDERGHITYVNDAGLIHLGLDRSWIGLPLDQLAATLSVCHIDGSPCAAPELPSYRVLSGEPRVDVREIVRRQDGIELRRWVRSTPLRGKSGVLMGSISVVRQIGTPSRGSGREDGQRRDFAAILAHELKNPLSVIASATQLLELKTGVESEHVRRITSQVRLMRRMIDDILESRRMHHANLRLDLRTEDLREIVTDAVDLVRERTIPRNQRVLISASADPITVNADSARIKQLLGNVLDNASKFSPDGATITIRVCADPVSGEAVIRVTDTGIGIDPSFRHRAFELFAQADPAQSSGGLGIGLAIARMIVELHGGHISAHSEGVGLGTEIMIRLPQIGTHPAGARDCSASGRNRRIVLAEDNGALADIMAELLSHMRCEVAVAADGPQAIQLITDLLPDIALVDIGLPRLNGHEVARQVRQDGRADSVFMVALSGNECKTADTGDFDLYEVKPVDVRELLARIDAEISMRRLNG